MKRRHVTQQLGAANDAGKPPQVDAPTAPVNESQPASGTHTTSRPSVEEFSTQINDAWERKIALDEEAREAEIECEDIARRAYATLASADFGEFADEVDWMEYFDEWVADPEHWVDDYRDDAPPSSGKSAGG